MSAVAKRSVVGVRLLGGPGVARETYAQHSNRLGARPRGGDWLVDVVKESGLKGRGGAWFPTWRKWAAVANHSAGDAVVVVNASEGEPLSAKDKTLLERRPHLILDGAALAAESVAAAQVVIYLSRGSTRATKELRQALQERNDEIPIGIEETSHRYVAGESSAAINRVSGHESKPRWSLTRSAEKGVRELPTLVQNAETIAHVAMIGRYGPEWFRRLGTAKSPGTTLMTLSGNVRHPGVYEVDLNASVAEVLHGVGGPTTPPAGALIGGYFGGWMRPESFEQPLDLTPLGCGVLAVLPQHGCPIVEATRILIYLAAESAGQCGPCLHGLAALATAMQRVATSRPEDGDIERVRRWIDMVKGRGACHHPDGAAGQLLSALDTFEDHLRVHLHGIDSGCRGVTGFPHPPAAGKGWR